MLKVLLAFAGAAFVAIAIGGFIWLFYSRRKHGQEEHRGMAKRLFPAAEAAVTLRDRYVALLAEHMAPQDARVVTGPAFSNSSEPVRQYCWVANGELVLLPLWESVELRYGALPPERVPLYAVRIPLACIVCYFEYQGMGGRCCALQYKSLGGLPLMLGFSIDSLYVFDQLIPELAHSCQVEQQYTRSQRNIQDINEIFLRLKELRVRNLISEDEYSEKKKQILIKM